MTDELTARRQSKRDGPVLTKYAAQKLADPELAAAAALLNSRAVELRPHAQAIAELLVAVAVQLELAPLRHDLTLLGFAWALSRALGVKQAEFDACVDSLRAAQTSQ